jgi:hypothetical protein
MTTPLRALACLLAPWRAIRRLEQENQRLSQALGDSAVELLTLHQRVSVVRSSRIRNCRTHGQQPPNAWGCPECVDQLRRENRALQAERDAAQEAVRRLVRWSLIGCDTQITRDVDLWATRDGMAGPLPPLPELLARREQQEEGGRSQ